MATSSADTERMMLRDAEARHRQIVNSATDTVIISTDLAGRVTSWNEGAYRITGFAESEMLGVSADRLFIPEDRAAGRLHAEMAQALARGHGEHEGWRVRKDGSRFWASGQMSPLRDEAGAVTGFVKIVRDRTTERAAIDALAAAREQLALAQRAGGIGSFVIDVASNRMTVSDELCRMFGLPITSDFDASEVERLFFEEDRPVASNPASRVTGTARPRAEYRIRRADDGVVRWIARNAEYVRDAAGQVTAMRGVTQDITERKLAEQALTASEAQFRTLAETMPHQVWTAPADGQIDWFNQRVHDYSGLPLAELAGDRWTRLVHPDDLPVVGAAWTASLATGALYETEFRILRADGTYRWHLVRAVPIAGEAGVARWVGTNTDIEDQKLALAELSRSNETLESQVAARTADRDRMWRLSTDVMLVADFAGSILSTNPAWTRLLGWTESELVGTNFIHLVHPDDVDATVGEVTKLAQGVTTLRFENRYLAKDGSYRPLAWTAVPENDLIHAVGRDVTDERNAAAELERAHEALRQAQKMEAVGQLTGGIAHDFNNLLTGIVGSLDMMLRRARQGRDPDVERYASAALGSANRAAALTHRLLAFSRRQPLDPRPVDANRLVAGMEELLRRSIGEAIVLEIVAARDLWRTRCDPHQLENAVLNLAINARDAMPDGGAITIETCNTDLSSPDAADGRDMAPGEYICLCVTDTGCGMSADIVAKAFDPFFTTKPIGHGTGLGLSMIYGFARQSEGYARIVSAPGEGTTVKLFLPRFDGEDDGDATQPAIATPARPGRGEVVLVVEDEPAVRALVIDVLIELGYRSIEAEDGPSGLRLIESDARIDLLVTDVGLPGLNGRQLADAARATRPGLKVLFMTGYAENAAVAGGFLDVGMELITKPFAIEALTERIRGMIDGG